MAIFNSYVKLPEGSWMIYFMIFMENLTQMDDK